MSTSRGRVRPVHAWHVGIAWLAVAGLAGLPAWAGVIQPIGVTRSSELSGREAYKCRDGSGMSGTDTNATHDTGTGNMWLSNHSTVVADQWIRFELNDVYDLSRIYIWNYYEGGVARGVKDFTVEVSVDGVNWSAPSSGASQTAAGATLVSSRIVAQVLSMEATNTRHIRFNIDSNYGDGYVGLAEVRFEGVLTPDTTPPALTALSPANGEAGVGVNANFKITFNDNITNGTGNIAIKKAAGGGVVETFAAATSPRLTWNYGSGRSVTIDPTGNLDAKTGYYVEIDNGAIKDDAGNLFAGFTGPGTWSVTTSGPLITGITVKAVSSEYTSLSRVATKAIDGSGLSAGKALYGTHSNGYELWLTTSPPPQFIIVDLGTNYVLDTIHVWNYNESGQLNPGMKDVRIWVTPTTSTNDLIKLDTNGSGTTDNGSGNFLFPQASGASDYLGFNVGLTGVGGSRLKNVRLVKIEAISNYGSSLYAGLSEVQFGGDRWVAPPGGTVIMLK
jgi:hypothetical protein